MDRAEIKNTIEAYLAIAEKHGRYNGAERDNALALADGWCKYLAAENAAF